MILFWTFQRRIRQFFFQSEAQQILHALWGVLRRLWLGIIGNSRSLLVDCRKLLVDYRRAMFLDETWKDSHAFIISFHHWQFTQFKRQIHVTLAYWNEKRATKEINLSKQEVQQIVAWIFAHNLATNEKCKINIDTTKQIGVLKIPNQILHVGSHTTHHNCRKGQSDVYQGQEVWQSQFWNFVLFWLMF